jgi:uncharacterized protein
MEHLPDFSELFFIIILSVVAFLYASVGHGGASGYLALMALFSVAPAEMRPSALMLNVFVSAIAFYQYYRSGHFSWNLFIPFAVASIPLAFAGAMIQIDPVWYKRILAFCLAFAAFRIFGLIKGTEGPSQKPGIPVSLGVGGSIGFLSGLIGIGGGIILSPLLILLRWSPVKQTAGISALFIFVNSLSGLAGLATSGAVFHSKIILWVMVAAAGGMAGSYFGSKRFNVNVLQKALAAVLLIAICKLMIT